MINKKIFSRLGVIAAFLLGICVITTNTGNDNSSSKKTVTASSNTITETKIDNNYEITAGVTSEVLNQTNIKAVDSAIVAKAQEEDSTLCGYNNLGIANITEGNLNVRDEASANGEIVGKRT